MDAPTFENLDLACAKAGNEIAAAPSKELENLLTSALAVLEEQGVYALFLFLKSRGGDEGKKVSQTLHKFLKVTPQQSPLLSEHTDNIGSPDVFSSLQQMAKNLDNLLLARDLVRQTLVYARYHARVPQKSEVQA